MTDNEDFAISNSPQDLPLREVLPSYIGELKEIDMLGLYE